MSTISSPSLMPRKQMLTRPLIHLWAMPLTIKLSLLWIGMIVFITFFSDWLTPYEITKMDLSNRLAKPLNPLHWLGTDELGRDVLSRLLKSIHVSMQIAFGATIFSALIGTTLGFIAARFRGIIEQCVLMLADFQAALPFLILSLAV